MQEKIYYVIIPIKGVNFNSDFPIYSAAIYGNGENYKQTEIGVHTKFREPYEVVSKIRFERYQSINSLNEIYMDAETILNVSIIKNKSSLSEFSCLAFEFENEKFINKNSLSFNSCVLKELIVRGERIVNTLRLFLFKPGDDFNLGILGMIENGIFGAWIGRPNGEMKFIARKISRFDLIQDTREIMLNELKSIYRHETFREIFSAAVNYPITDPFLEKLFRGLSTYRESRDLFSNEARMRHIFTLIEGLIKKNDNDRLNGKALRNRINTFAKFCDQNDTINEITELWDNLRNPLSHTNQTLLQLNREPKKDLIKLETIAVRIFHSMVTAWKYELLNDNKDLYDIIME